MNELSDQTKTISEKLEILRKFMEVLYVQEDCPVRYQEIVTERFWDLQ